MRKSLITSYITLVVLVILSSITTSCLKSYVNAPKDVNAVSKIVSKNIHKGTSRTIPYNSRQVYIATLRTLTQPHAAVVRYKYNHTTKQYHSHSFLYSIAPPNRTSGAIVSSKTGAFKAVFNLVIVYIEPKGKQTNIRVVTIANSNTTESDVIQNIINAIN